MSSSLCFPSVCLAILIKPIELSQAGFFTLQSNVDYYTNCLSRWLWGLLSWLLVWSDSLSHLCVILLLLLANVESHSWWIEYSEKWNFGWFSFFLFFLSFSVCCCCRSGSRRNIPSKPCNSAKWIGLITCLGPPRGMSDGMEMENTMSIQGTTVAVPVPGKGRTFLKYVLFSQFSAFLSIVELAPFCDYFQSCAFRQHGQKEAKTSLLNKLSFTKVQLVFWCVCYCGQAWCLVCHFDAHRIHMAETRAMMEAAVTHIQRLDTQAMMEAAATHIRTLDTQAMTVQVPHTQATTSDRPPKMPLWQPLMLRLVNSLLDCQVKGLAAMCVVYKTWPEGNGKSILLTQLSSSFL